MPKVLILSASTGHGHNQAANCLKYYLESSDYQVKIVEPFKEEGRIIETLIDDGYYILASHLPQMYGKIYKMTDQKLINKGVAAFFIKTLSNTVNQLVQEYLPDLIISTHPLHINVISYLKAKGEFNKPFIAIVTDYMAHRFYINHSVDAYIVASSYTKQTLINRGIPANKIFTYGIPVRVEFLKPRVDRKDQIFTLLIMGGSMGISYIKECLGELVNNENKLKIIVVCGSNHKLKKKLEAKYSGEFKNKEVIILGFTPDIPNLMDQSDVLVTKPGGLTVTEAISKNIPMIIPFFIPGQEEENTEFLLETGVAVRVNNASELNKTINRFYHNRSLLESMRQKARELSKEISPESIVPLANSLIFNYYGQKEPGS